jgi:hypothetical protein
MLSENLFFSLLRYELCGAGVEEEKIKSLTEKEYRELYILSKKHDLAHIVASALAQLGALKDDSVSEAFNLELMAAVYRNGQQNYTLDLIEGVFDNAKISYIPLKGSVLRNCYPHPWMRTSCDVDVLIRPRDSERAISALSQAGFKRLKDSSTHDYNFLAPNKVHVELHYTLCQEGNLAACNTYLESVWEKYSSPSEGGSRYNVSGELFLLFHLAHMGRHLLSGGCGIRPFMDLWIINKHIPYDRDILTEMLDDTGLRSLYELFAKLSLVWFEGEEHNEKTQPLSAYVINGGAFGTLDNASKMKAARGIGSTKSLFKMMFLPKRNLQVLYPALIKRPYLLPFYQVKRWFRVFKKDKRDKIKQLMISEGAVSQKDLDTAKALLDSLGLVED